MEQKNDHNVDFSNQKNIVEILINVIKENTISMHHLLETIKTFLIEQKGNDTLQNKNIDDIIEKVEIIDKNSERILQQIESIKKILEKKTFIAEVVIVILTLVITLISLLKVIK